MLTFWANFGIFLIFMLLLAVGLALFYILLGILEELIMRPQIRKQQRNNPDKDGFYVY